MICLISWLISLLLVVTRTHSRSEWYHLLSLPLHHHHHRHREVEEPKCVLNPCQNGGTCTAYRDRFHCTCKKGWIGDNCERRSICYPNPCIHGRCSASLTGFTCTCLTGYKGELCDAVQHCHPNPCWNGGSCTESSSNVYCDCQPGFRGRFCEYETKCTPFNPCVNGGECREMLESYYCMCNEPYAGINCEMIRPPTPQSSHTMSYVEGPQAIPSPAEYKHRAIYEGGIQSKGNQSTQNHFQNSASDISLAKTIFSPTVFDPPPFVGVKDPDMNTLHKATPAILPPEIYNEIKLEQQDAMLGASTSSDKKIKDEKVLNKSENDNPKENIFMTSSNSTSPPGAIEMDKNNLPQEGIDIFSSNVSHLKSQEVSESNGTKRSLLKANKLSGQRLPSGNITIAAPVSKFSERHLGVMGNNTPPSMNGSIHKFNGTNLPSSTHKFDAQKISNIISEASSLINKYGRKHFTNQSRDEIIQNDTDIRTNKGFLKKKYIGCNYNEYTCATKTDRKKVHDVMADIRSGVSLLRLRGNIAVFHKGSRKLRKNFVKMENKGTNNVMPDIVRIRYRNGTGVSYLRTRGNVVHGKWSHKFLNNSAEIKRKNNKTLTSYNSRAGERNVTLLPKGRGISNSTRNKKARADAIPIYRNKMNNTSNAISKHRDEAKYKTLLRQQGIQWNVSNGTKGNRTSFRHNGSYSSPGGTFVISTTAKSHTFYFWPKSDVQHNFVRLPQGVPSMATVASKMHELRRYMPQNIPYATSDKYKKFNYFPTDRNVPHTTSASSNRRFYYLPHIAPYATTKTSLNDFFPPAETLTYRITTTPRKQLVNSPKQLSYPTSQRRHDLNSNSFYLRNTTNIKVVAPHKTTGLTKHNILYTTRNNECPNFCQSFCDPWCERIGCCVATNDQLKAIENFEQKYASKEIIPVPKGKQCTKCHRYSDCVDGHCLCKKGFFGNGGKCWPLPIPVK